MGKKSKEQSPNPQTCPIFLDLVTKTDGESPKCGDALLVLSDMRMCVKVGSQKLAGNKKLAEDLGCIINNCAKAHYDCQSGQYNCQKNAQIYNRIKEALKPYTTENEAKSFVGLTSEVGD